MSIKEILLKPKPNDDALLEAIRRVHSELKNVWRWFDAETDPDLMDACIYRRKALEAEYRYLIRTAKKDGLNVKFEEFI